MIYVVLDMRYMAFASIANLDLLEAGATWTCRIRFS